jgi:protein-S-isoprenylcysteine O-methyltransferase Ste14
VKGLLSALYSACVYVLFLGVFLYAIAFVEGVAVPKTIDSGATGPLASSLLINTGLLALFAVQHSAMARPGFKRWWTRFVPPSAERSTYVLLASLALALLLWQWRPLPALVWSIDDPVLSLMVRIVSWSGWALLLLSTFLISHFHLFGLSQGMASVLKLRPPTQEFVTPLFYRWIRHPLYAGFILAFWAAPQMSVGHLFFAAATTAYILVGIWLEERDLVAEFGARYLRYRETTGMLLPRLRIGARRGPAAQTRLP